MKKFLEKSIMISGTLARVFIGASGIVLLLCSLKKKKAK
jgi:hypothetical protein